MGSGKKQTVGYHYKYLLHYGLSRGPIDAFLEFRGSDRTAWKGYADVSSTITINAPQLWGGEKNEGGITGAVDLMFGEQTQMPNAWLIENQGPDQTAYRGKFTWLFKGGRMGINPYPKSVAFKFRRIFKGWDDDVCWYPEKAGIVVAGVNGGYRVTTMASNALSSPDGGVSWQDDLPVGINLGQAVHLLALPDRYVAHAQEFVQYTLDGKNWTEGASLGGSGSFDSVYFKDQIVVAAGNYGIHRSLDGGVTVLNDAVGTGVPPMNYLAASPTMMLGGHTSNFNFFVCSEPGAAWEEAGEHGLFWDGGVYYAYGNDVFMAGSNSVSLLTTPRLVSTPNGYTITVEDLPDTGSPGFIQGIAYGNQTWAVGLSNGHVIYRPNGDAWAISSFTAPFEATGDCMNFHNGYFYFSSINDTWKSMDCESWELTNLGPHVRDIVGGKIFDKRTFATMSMNPAHMLIDSLVSQDMQGEPWDSIDGDSFAACADRLFDESFGLITIYDHQEETTEDFQQRICNVVGAALTQSRIDGRYRMDLIRGDYELADLPILTDADILEFEREPSNPNDSVNEVVVEWFDPDKKQARSTTPMQSLGAIQSCGATISETAKYPEIPSEELALRVGARDLKNKASPVNRFKMTTTRKAFGWRSGTVFRLQAPRRGIADMVCLVGELESGTMRSAAMRMTAVQDVTGLPSSVYVNPEPGVDTGFSSEPDPVPAQDLFEAPYIELAGTLPAGELAALGEESGYVIGVATRPDSEINYGFFTAPPLGGFEDRGPNDWVPTGLVVEAATRNSSEVAFTLTDRRDLDRVAVGTAALWGDELVRVDSISPTTGFVVLGRGVGDTPPTDHLAGERIWFYDAWGATDQIEYLDGEQVSAKFITYTPTAELAENAAPSSTIAIDSRAARPYAPGNLRIEDSQAPASAVANPIELTLAHRDRVMQADQLVEYGAASIGAEPGVEYIARYYDTSDDALLFEADPFTTASISTHEFPFTGNVRLEVHAERDGLESWRPAVVEFIYQNDGVLLLTEAGETLTTEGGEPISTET